MYHVDIFTKSDKVWSRTGRRSCLSYHWTQRFAEAYKAKFPGQINEFHVAFPI